MKKNAKTLLDMIQSVTLEPIREGDITIEMAAKQMGVSYPTSREQMLDFVKQGIVIEVAVRDKKGRRRRVFRVKGD